MKKMVSPSLLSADFSNLEKEMKLVAAAGADLLHIDVMDGHFVPNLTMGPPVVSSLKKVAPLPLDVHLMIENPEKWIEAFCKAGSDYLTIHVESSKDPMSDLKKIRSFGVKSGITLRPKTTLDKILPFLAEVDLVLVMTVEPGFSGQSFMHEQVTKISKLAELRKKNNFSYLIEVDGGINAETVKLCVEADIFVAGNYVFKNNYAEAIAKLKEE